MIPQSASHRARCLTGSDGASPSWSAEGAAREYARPPGTLEIGSYGASPSSSVEIGAPESIPSGTSRDEPAPARADLQTVTLGTLKARAERVINDFESGETRLEGNVQAEITTDPALPPTLITTERLIIRRAEGIARAEGATRVVDEAGTVEANNLEIRFTPAEEGKPSVFLYATAQQPRLKLGKALISGEVLRIEPGVWIIEQGQAMLVDLARGGTRIRARRIRIYPGDYGVAEQAVFTVAGQPLPPVPRLRFNLDRRVTGIKPPNLTNRRGVGFGISWDSFVAVGSQSAVGASWNSFPGLAPSYRLEYVYSTLDARRQPFSIAPRDDLDERVRDGWFNNVGVGTPEEEAESLRRDLSSASFGTMWNVATSARVPDSQDVSKAWQAGYDFGRQAGGWGQRLTFKVHRIRPDDLTNWVDRGLVYASVSAPPLRLSRDWAVVSRADLFGTFSNRGQFGFARTELGLIGRPGGGLTLGAAYAYGYETGRPDFAFDRLVAPEAFLLRADYQRGPWTFRYLAKFDIRARSWYDREWELALVAGSFEPFMLRREFPTDYRIGIRFRIDDLVNRLQRRDFRRGEEAPGRIVGK